MELVTRDTWMGRCAEGYGQKHRTHLRSAAARLATVGLFGALGLAGLAPATARAQAAGQSVSHAEVGEYPPPPSCSQTSGPATTTGSTCFVSPVGGGTGTSTTASNNATRTISASSTLTKTGGSGSLEGDSYAVSIQASALTVTGTPSIGDQLVFHFLTSQSATGSGGSATSDASGVWELLLQSGSSQAGASQYGNADGTQDPVGLQNATQTATGFDLTLPFSVGSVFSYAIRAQTEPYAAFSPYLAGGATFTGSISAYLQGIDAETANGMFINSASFDPLTGLGTISATPTTTTPEPNSLALLGTGVIGLIPVMRRRKS